MHKDSSWQRTASPLQLMRLAQGNVETALPLQRECSWAAQPTRRVGSHDGGRHVFGVTIGRGQSPTAGRKVEAGPQADELSASSSHQLRSGVHARTGVRVRRRLRRITLRARSTPASCWGWTTYARAQRLTNE